MTHFDRRYSWPLAERCLLSSHWSMLHQSINEHLFARVFVHVHITSHRVCILIHSNFRTSSVRRRSRDLSGMTSNADTIKLIVRTANDKHSDFELQLSPHATVHDLKEQIAFNHPTKPVSAGLILGHFFIFNCRNPAINVWSSLVNCWAIPMCFSKFYSR